MRWHCTSCGKYSDPQSLDYETGECWDCQEKPDTRLDDIFDRHSEDTVYQEMQDLYDATGGCSCHLGHAPCSWCEHYDFDNDPLNLYSK